jgi:hypothetical protein
MGGRTDIKKGLTLQWVLMLIQIVRMIVVFTI